MPCSDRHLRTTSSAPQNKGLEASFQRFARVGRWRPAALEAIRMKMKQRHSVNAENAELDAILESRMGFDVWAFRSIMSHL